MKKYLSGGIAIILAFCLSAFSIVSEKSKPFTVYFKNTGPDKANPTWVSIPGEPAPADCEENSNNYCYGYAASGSTPTTFVDGDYVGDDK